MALTEDDDFVLQRDHPVDRDWVSDIEQTLQWCASEWHLTPGVERQSGLNGYVIDALMDDGSVTVLKIRRPDRNMQREADALLAFDGVKSVKLLERSDEHGALLLERVEPGDQLAQRPDTVSADEIICSLASSWRGIEAPSSAVALDDQARRWAASLDRMSSVEMLSPVGIDEYSRAAAELRGLADSLPSGRQLLHGDLHLGNVISSDSNGWTAVDPKGMAGEALFDLAWWLRDPPLGLEDADAMEGPLRARFDAIIGSGAEADRCLAWARSCAVVLTAARTCALSTWDARRHAACAEALRRL